MKSLQKQERRRCLRASHKGLRERAWHIAAFWMPPSRNKNTVLGSFDQREPKETKGKSPISRGSIMQHTAPGSSWSACSCGPRRAPARTATCTNSSHDPGGGTRSACASRLQVQPMKKKHGVCLFCWRVPFLGLVLKGTKRPLQPISSPFLGAPHPLRQAQTPAGKPRDAIPKAGLWILVGSGSALCLPLSHYFSLSLSHSLAHSLSLSLSLSLYMEHP